MFKRIQWVDIVKGIAILSMVIGHSLQNFPGGRLLTLLIYSFHMPIFFIMSGVTTKTLTDNKKILFKLIKLAKKILIPTVIIVVICTLERIYFHIYSWSMFWKVIGNALLYAQPTDARGNFTIDAMWFLVVFFWSKAFFYLVTKIVGLDYSGVVFGVLAYICYCFADKVWLIQSWDLVPVASLFMWLGAELRKNFANIQKYQVGIFLVAFIIWIWGLQQQIRIDMAIRVFPDFIVSIIFIVCASFCVIYFSEGISNTRLGKFLAFSGRETLPLLYINTIDFFWVWGIKNLELKGYYYTLTRVSLDLLLLFAWVLVVKLYRKMREKKRG